MARSPTRLRSAAMERLLRLTARRRVGRSARRWVGRSAWRRVGRSVGLGPTLVVVTGRPVGRPVPDGPRVLLPTSGRRVAWGPETFVSVVEVMEAGLRSRCSPRGEIHQRWGVVGVPKSPPATSPLDQGPLTVILKVVRLHVSFRIVRIRIKTESI